jgi:trigger factor
VEGKPLEGWKVNDHLVQVGSQSLAGNLDERLVGLPRNQERNVTITLPETYSRKELAGKEVNVRLKVKEIKEKVLAVLDDEFAREVGDFQTLQELRARMRQNLEKQKQAQANQAAREKLLDILREKNPFAIPQSMIERQFQHIVARTEIQLARQGIKLDSGSLDSGKIRDSLTPTAEKEVRGSLILEKVAEKENISVTEDDLERRLEQLAANLNQRIEAVKQYYQQKGRMEDLRAILLEEKTLDFLLDKAKIIEERPAAPDPGPGNRPEEK